MRAQARLNMTEDEKAQERERWRLAKRRFIAEETDTDRAMRLADRAQRREDIKWSKYIHPVFAVLSGCLIYCTCTMFVLINRT